MIEIKYIVVILTFVIGIVYTRKELKELFLAMFERDYVELEELKVIQKEKHMANPVDN